MEEKIRPPRLRISRRIKKNKVFDTKENLPGLGNVPVIGNIFKGQKKSDSMDELLIFIAPRVL